MRLFFWFFLFPLFLAPLDDISFAISFRSLANQASARVEQNLSEERIPSAGLPDDLVYICLSGCADTSSALFYRLRSKRCLLLTGKPYSVDFVHYRKIE